MLTNGPGDPKDNGEIIENREDDCWRGQVFRFSASAWGISCMALAMGADTEKLKYGHRGSNHPVKDLKKDRVYITSQNHGYAIVGEVPAANAQSRPISP